MPNLSKYHHFALNVGRQVVNFAQNFINLACEDLSNNGILLDKSVIKHASAGPLGYVSIDSSAITFDARRFILPPKGFSSSYLQNMEFQCDLAHGENEEIDYNIIFVTYIRASPPRLSYRQSYREGSGFCKIWSIRESDTYSNGISKQYLSVSEFANDYRSILNDIKSNMPRQNALRKKLEAKIVKLNPPVKTNV
jgi:hypothetical protein